MLKDDLEPVAKWKLCKTVDEQIARIKDEHDEAEAELAIYNRRKKYGAKEEELERTKKNCAIELGDVIISAVGAISMLGYSLEEIVKIVHEKNSVRGYYSDK